jgi:hypothetical protein
MGSSRSSSENKAFLVSIRSMMVPAVMGRRRCSPQKRVRFLKAEERWDIRDISFKFQFSNLKEEASPMEDWTGCLRLFDDGEGAGVDEVGDSNEGDAFFCLVADLILGLVGMADFLAGLKLADFLDGGLGFNGWGWFGFF